MVRLINRDDLDDARGRLGTAFRAASLTTLHAAFLAAAGAGRKNAAAVLEHFHQAADALGSREKEFNNRARSAAPTLMKHLRSVAQLEAMRTFSKAKRALLNVNAEIGREIAQMVERNVDAAAQKPVQAASPAAPVNHPSRRL